MKTSRADLKTNREEMLRLWKMKANSNSTRTSKNQKWLRPKKKKEHLTPQLIMIMTLHRLRKYILVTLIFIIYSPMKKADAKAFRLASEEKVIEMFKK